MFSFLAVLVLLVLVIDSIFVLWCYVFVYRCMCSIFVLRLSLSRALEPRPVVHLYCFFKCFVYFRVSFMTHIFMCLETYQVLRLSVDPCFRVSLYVRLCSA